MFSELNDPARQPSVYASLCSLARSQARLEARMESLLLFRRALSSPTMCRFIPALSVLHSLHSRCIPVRVTSVWSAFPSCIPCEFAPARLPLGTPVARFRDPESGVPLRMVCPDSRSLNDLYCDIGSARQELERCRRPGLHWYVPGLMEW